MRNSRIIKVGEKEITVRELSVLEIDGLFESYRTTKASTHSLDLLLDKAIPFDMILLATGHNEEELLSGDVTPRELEPLYEQVLELNPSLATMAKKVGTIVAEVVKAG